MPLLINIDEYFKSCRPLRKRLAHGEGATPSNSERLEAYLKEIKSYRSARSTSRNFFPYELMEMLCSPFFSDCLVWTNDGKAFFMTAPKIFLIKYAHFHRLKSVPKKGSFERKLNRWGFRMELRRGPRCSSYSHVLFLRDKSLLCEDMICQRNRSTRSIQANNLVISC